jgi:hypothetical protein
VGQRAFALHRCDLGVEQFVVHGDFAHLGFQPGDFIIPVVAFAFLFDPALTDSADPQPPMRPNSPGFVKT